MASEKGITGRIADGQTEDGQFAVKADVRRVGALQFHCNEGLQRPTELRDSSTVII